MGNFVKELTIIDFLGMIVPGSLLVLLFNRDYELQSIWSDYFENDMAANTIILLIAGYLIGMLIHELGDVLEKQIWKTNWFNPRYYAAREVFLNVEEKYKDFDSTEWNAFTKSCGESAKDGQEKSDEKEQEWKQTLLSAVSLEISCLTLFILPALIAILKKLGNIGINMLILFAIIAGGFLITIKLIGYICAKNGNEHKKNKKDDAAKVMKYLKQNAAIQTEVFGKGTAAKRQIFDGFYCVMRNFLIGVGITNVYSIIMAFLDRDSDLLCRVNTFYQDWVQIVIYYIVVVGMLHRCWHYAWLKYKYTYEDFLYILKQKENQPGSKKSVVIRMSNRE